MRSPAARFEARQSRRHGVGAAPRFGHCRSTGLGFPLGTRSKGNTSRDARILERDGSVDRTDRKDRSELEVKRCADRRASGTACQPGGKRVQGYPERPRDQTMACAREGMGSLAWILADWMGWTTDPAPDCPTRRENGRGLEDKMRRGFKHCLPRISLPEDL